MSRPADIDKMSDNDYIAFMQARRHRFYKAGLRFNPVVNCNLCEPIMDNNYICIEHELHQLEEEGY